MNAGPVSASMRDLRPELAEAFGTAMMMLAGGAAILSGQPPLVVALAFGGTVMVMIYALGHVCGAHFNPAITMAFAATRHFPWPRVPAYIASQLLGAAAACLVLLAWRPLGPAVAVGSLEGLPAFLVEALATSLLAFVIVAVATDPRAAMGMAGLAIGAAVAIGALVAGPLTGAAMNPARALAPAVVAGAWPGLAVHVLGPLAGAVAGMLAYEGLRRGARPPAEATLGTAGPIDLGAKA